jgi:DtxR family Mn-dependent transcriptional regulator
VVEVRIEEAEQLRYLGTLDLYPGASVAVVERAPFEGPLSLRVNGVDRVLARSLADRIHVAVESE